MSGPEDTREPADAGAQAVPASPAPPSFGGADSQAAAPPAADEPEVAPSPLKLTPFGLQTPWWAADPAPAPQEQEPAPEETAPPEAEAPPGTLVAGLGVPSVDSRGAVPAEPLLRRPSLDYADTDPDGIPPVPPESDDAPSGGKTAPQRPTVPPQTTASAQDAAFRQDAPPGQGAASTQETAPAQGAASAQGAVSTQGDAPAQDDGPTQYAASAQDAAFTHAGAATRGAASVQDAALTQDDASAQDSASTQDAAAPWETAPVQGAASAQGAVSTQGDAPAQDDEPTEDSAATRDTAPMQGAASPESAAFTQDAASDPGAASAQDGASTRDGASVEGGGSAPGAASARAEADRIAAFERAKEAEKAAGAALSPVLVPDAILPPGVRPPPSGSGPFTTTPEAGPELEAGAVGPPTMAAVLTPVYHSEGEIPLDEPSAPGPAQPSAPAQAAGKEGAGKRRLLLVGGGAAAVLAAVAALFAIGGTGSGDDGAARKPAESPAASPAAPGTASPVPAPGAVNIDDEKTDPNDLAFADVFPTATLRLGGRTFTRDRWSINRDLAYAANGAMLRALTRENCRKVVRATYLDRSRSIAVTSGIAVMPTSAAALKVSRVGDPARYEWFRGMAGKHAPDIDRAGGYAAVTVRGRYVVYAYVQRIDGKQVKPGDPAIKQAAQQFLDHDVRPIEARARR